MWIGISKIIDLKVLEQKIVDFINPYSFEMGNVGEISYKTDLYAYCEQSKSEFPFVLRFGSTIAIDDENKYLKIAEYISKEFSCKTITDALNYGLDKSEYWSIIFENGISYLAEDSNSDLFDGTGGEVKILKRTSLKY
ncbi:MAG: hypothetical protein R2799_04850 [Crocinitomicaceae bacterium]